MGLYHPAWRCVFLPQLAMERTPSVKAAPCAPETTAVWTASPNSSCSCGGRGWGSTESVCTTVRPDTTAYAAQSSTFAPVSPQPPFQIFPLAPCYHPNLAIWRAHLRSREGWWVEVGWCLVLAVSPSGFKDCPGRRLTSPLQRSLCVTVHDQGIKHFARTQTRPASDLSRGCARDPYRKSEPFRWPCLFISAKQQR